ncbi:pentapeptide repeat-containing protein [Histidinibacterium lentulum]|uniref:Pentapeptide repeat-containing protein n=1 Tax=Histidinibacterium lentulum TaxID=2480588 RepID=A0A3N2R4E6_9RHOB|nr:pentapeptide repeat-containing protein [Histidinibacterium lentulum]ROU02354.1 hypothetical protein EAT49_08380 [Histidinibacterium lentulum]
MTDEYQRAFYIFVIACAAIPVLLAIAVGVFSLGDSTTRRDIARKTKLDLLPAPIRRLAYAAGALALFLWTSLVAVAVCGLILTLVVTLFRLVPDTTPLGRFFPDTGNWRLELFLIAALTGTLGAMIAFPFTIARVLFTRRQTVAQEEDLLTKRINEAVEGLGAEKEVSRIGRSLRVYTGTSYSKAMHVAPFQEPDLPHLSILKAREAVEVEEDGVTEEKRLIRYTQWTREETRIHWQDAALPVSAGEGVGHYGDWMALARTEPNLEVRTGAILALERLAQKNLSVHVQIMQILCAYIRENAAFSGPTSPGGALMSPDDLPKKEKVEDRELLPINAQWAKVRAYNHQFVSFRTDIRTALDVLSRRFANSSQPTPETDWQDNLAGRTFGALIPPLNEVLNGTKPADFLRAGDVRIIYPSFKGYRPNLRGADLRFADLGGLDLRGAVLEKARMQGANLFKAKIQEAVLSGAQMQGTDLEGALMQHANLSMAQMQGSNLIEAQMQNTLLFSVRMHGATLREAKLQSASLFGVEMQGVTLVKAQLQRAVLIGATMQEADLGGAQMQRATVMGAQMQGAGLRGAQMQGAVLLGAQMDDHTDLSAATLRGAALRALDATTMASLQPFWHDVFSDMALPEGAQRPAHWPPTPPEDFDTAWRAWQATLPEGWDRTWPEDDGRPDEDWSDAYRDFRARWDAATRGKAPPENG